ncbi:glycosyltransferase [uncultured Helicobacter sp.]|uniref:glycosyltransferase n=1 Tax=uncultured Helicobacter sp. TaxID=175537 RepID=UPI00374E2486
MTIAFVVDIYKDRSNGTSMSAFRCARELLRRGHEVRIIATKPTKALTSPKLPKETSFEIGDDGEKIYFVKERYIPIVTEVSHKQHMVFGAPDENLMREVLKGCDVVHFFLPFRLEIMGIALCKELQIPYTTAFHMQPQHISYALSMNFAWFNDYLYRRLFRGFYRYTHHIHCPSKLMREELERIGYGGKKYVISNGFDGGTLQAPRGVDFGLEEGVFHIASVGRFSKEKRQDILIKAIARNKYAHKIKLHLHGLGPRESYLKRLCEKYLRGGYEFGFIENALLLQKLKAVNLYCHPAQVESEAISCLEAISLGVVPLIADSKVSATNQFALDSRSLFRTNDIEDLSEKITYWIENPHALDSMREAYRQSVRQYALSLSVDKMLRMFEEAIIDFKQDRGLFEKVHRLAPAVNAGG